MLRHIQNLSFPRRAGSPGEEAAFRYIMNFFRRYPFDIEVQNFAFSTLPPALVPRLIPLLVVILLLLSSTFLGGLPVLSTLIASSIIPIFIFSTRWSCIAEIISGYGGTEESRNIIARIPGKGSEREIVFMAHYDSKSQIVPIMLRIAGTIVFLLLSFVTAALVILAASAAPFAGKKSILYTLSIACLFALPGILNFSRNRSPGAIDNASGVALLLELARVISENHRKGMPAFTFVATAVEEEGLIGSLHFIKKFGSRFDRRTTSFINFDGAGAPGRIILMDRYGIPPVKTGKTLSGRFMNIAGELGIDLHQGYLPPGAGVDTLPISYRGFEAITFSSGKLSRAILSIHTPGDTPDNVSIDSLEKLATLSIAFAMY
ncbi:MAG: M28 family peptidase [Acidobacteriota bacterium]